VSAFDDLYASVLKERQERGDMPGRRRGDLSTPPGLTPSEAFDLTNIAAALELARRNEGLPLPEEYALPDYPGQMLELRVQGVEVGSHGLTGSGRDTAYLAQTTIDGAGAPRVRIEPRRVLRDVVAERAALSAWGKEIPVGVKAFDDRFLIRARSKRAAALFLKPELVAALTVVRKSLVDITVQPENNRTLVEVRVRVDSAREAGPAVALARAAHAAADRLARTPGGFADEAEAKTLTPEQLRQLVLRVQESTSFLAGQVERQGDGVEARFELDRPEGLKGILRIEATSETTVRTSLKGDLLSPPDKTAVLSPEVGVLKKALGLLDPKVGDDAIDKAFLIEGPADVARIALCDRSAVLRLAGRGCTLTVDKSGMSIVVPSVPAEDAAFLEVTAAVIAAWREAAMRNAGFTGYAVERE
jgi:hypothetical protein